MMEQERTDVYDLIPAPEVSTDFTYIHTGKNRMIRVYNQVDVRLTLADFLCEAEIVHLSLRIFEEK